MDIPCYLECKTFRTKNKKFLVKKYGYTIFFGLRIVLFKNSKRDKNNNNNRTRAIGDLIFRTFLRSFFSPKNMDMP